MLGLKNTLWNTVTGMNTSKAALSTVGHNIANANTEGYSRQQVTIGAQAPVKALPVPSKSVRRVKARS